MFIFGLLAGALMAVSPSEVLKTDGQLTLSDGSSYFVFKADGSFQSFPVGESGRTFEGTWSSQSKMQQVEVTARQGWVNGTSAPDDFRRIVFRINAGQRRPLAKPLRGTLIQAIFDGYFLIDELVRVPGPGPQTTNGVAAGAFGSAPLLGLDAAISRVLSFARDRHLDLTKSYLQRAEFDVVSRQWRLEWADVPRSKGGQTIFTVPEAGEVTVALGK